MADRLVPAVSPYLRSHADNPVDWFPWGEEAFAEARRRDVPVLVSIGYSTCHWCHVMARESFSEPVIAARLNSGFVAIKVDREEHPDVDASYLAAAAAFTGELGWPLNVFVTPQGAAFYAGTYWPPVAATEQVSFAEILDAVSDAWTKRRDEVERTAAAVVAALRESATGSRSPAVVVHPAAADNSPAVERERLLDSAVAELLSYEDKRFGGFGGAPKFPVAPAVLFLLERAAGDGGAASLAGRTLAAISGQQLPADRPFAALRDRIDGGFFRYATRANWGEPHYERMLYDNAQLLVAFTRLAQLDPEQRAQAVSVAEGIAGFLIDVLQQPDGGFASAQDSESQVDGVRQEGAYFALEAKGRAVQVPPSLDAKVLTGWNGLAIGAIAAAGKALGRGAWIASARRAADAVISRHLLADGNLIRASIGERVSNARATLEDYGMFASGLLELATATGMVDYAVIARDLVDRAIAAAEPAAGATGDTAGNPIWASRPQFGVPGGADPVLVAQGTALAHDPSEGAYPSGLSAMAAACLSLYLLTDQARYRHAAAETIKQILPVAAQRPVSFGAALAVASNLGQPVEQLVVVTDKTSSALGEIARSGYRAGSISVVVTRAQAAAFAAAGFTLFEGRQTEAAYLCRDFVCRLPIKDAAVLSIGLARARRETRVD